MSEETEVIEQLAGGSLPLKVVAGLFSDNASFQMTVAAFLQAGGPTVVSLTSDGTFYYGCSVGSHCAGGGMSLEVTVAPAAPVPGADPVLVVLAIGFAGLLAAGASRKANLTNSL